MDQELDSGPVDEALRLKRGLRDRTQRRWLRERAGLSQEALGRALGVPQGTVARWEAGTHTPRGSYARAYVAVLDRLAAEVGEVSEND